MRGRARRGQRMRGNRYFNLRGLIFFFKEGGVWRGWKRMKEMRRREEEKMRIRRRGNPFEGGKRVESFEQFGRCVDEVHLDYEN